jgi:hypothetical protein
MVFGFALFIGSIIALYGWLFLNLFSQGTTGIVRNLVLMLLILPLFVLLQMVHWLGFLIDAIIFPGYRRTAIEKPVFVTGIPRSGTTFLHRTLAEDKRFTAITLWEALFAPSITERYLIKAFGFIFKPLSLFSKWVQTSFGRKMSSIHQLGLSEAEEDFLLLLPIFSCFIQMVLVPQNPGVWKLAFFDTELSGWKKKIVMNFYRTMVKKHLYFHGRDLTYLSKNPSFTSMLPSLMVTFEDAHFVACYRSPEKTVPSQLSSLKPAFDLLHHDIQDAFFKEQILKMLHHYYQVLNNIKDTHPDKLTLVNMKAIKEDLLVVLRDLYKQFDMSMSADLQLFYEQISGRGRQYSSGHRYSLSDFELNEKDVCKRFESVWPLVVPEVEQGAKSA